LTVDIERLERLLAEGSDSAALRLALGSAYLQQNDARRAIEHLAAAVQLDADYSAAWKLLGRAQSAAGMLTEAQHSFTRGIDVATQRGDVQAAREMHVFLKRLKKRDDASQT